ncbi:MAG: UDP pyrophosphate synthase [Candidatus Syntrophoarchaeum caldarius]|uniref:Tritrans,polycis-undecaprenyl-diphosphate synthase (geranylgeranyl-diphosphate specific) n=1 Tax=Candidatus Syntropharchaeum caldarium TaxID=1838285 RepID=A0A1F2P9R6_9EURY|nr:MAG: UDP pyrophosphate synthase [Candidatus Syntrophoarchaeum caldarius]
MKIFKAGNYLKRLLYHRYERVLEKEVLRSEIPAHLAVIMDGNRRYASRIGEASYRGHFYGARIVEDLLEWSLDIGISHLTLYAFSIENFDRDEEEKAKIFELITKKFDELRVDQRIHKNRVRISTIGDIKLLPVSLQDAIKRAEEATAGYQGMRLNIALAYSGKREITRALQKIGEEVAAGKLSPQEITEDTLTAFLYENNSRDVDHMIRTGGENRTSNFMPWQASGSECSISFLMPLWPELRRIDFLRAIRTYQRCAAKGDRVTASS